MSSGSLVGGGLRKALKRAVLNLGYGKIQPPMVVMAGASVLQLPLISLLQDPKILLHFEATRLMAYPSLWGLVAFERSWQYRSFSLFSRVSLDKGPQRAGRSPRACNAELRLAATHHETV